MDLIINEVGPKTFIKSTIYRNGKLVKTELKQMNLDEFVKSASNNVKKSFIDKVKDFLYGV